MTALRNPAKEYVPMPMVASDDSEWKPVDYPGIRTGYEVSLYGQVRSPKGQLIKPQLRSGNLIVAVRQTGSTNSTTVRLDRLVLSAFDHYSPSLMPEHRDGDEYNCQLINLRWREPTEREQHFLKAAVSRRQADAARGGRGKKRAKAPVEPPAPLPSQPRAVEVEMFRTYRAAGLTVEVTAAGEIPAKGLPQGKLTAAKVAALAKILQAAVEMNAFMGVRGEL